MEQEEDAASHGPGFGENNMSQEQENPPPPPPPNRLEAPMALLLENQNMMMQAAQMGGGAGMSLLDRFMRLYSSKFGGSVAPAEAEFWLHGVERVFGILAVPDD